MIMISSHVKVHHVLLVLVSLVLILVLWRIRLRSKKEPEATEQATQTSVFLSPLPPFPPIVLPLPGSAELQATAVDSPEESPAPPPPVAPPSPPPSIADVRDIPMFTPRHALIPE